MTSSSSGSADVDRDAALREHLRKILDWEDAHVGFDAAVKGIPPAQHGVAPPGFAHSPWQLLEHVRRCQWDILDFCRNPAYAEPASMEEYWPPTPAPYRRDREELKRLAEDRSVDLFARIPHGSGQTVLRELLLVADHNAYHVGQLVAVRRALGAWE
jgi:hypothetical protein